jgi:hypothetical protein
LYTGKEKEVIAMRAGGNKLLNAIFEANMIDKSMKPDKHTELEERSEFIYKKYQHRQWYDPAACEIDLNKGQAKEDPVVDWGSFSFPTEALDAFNNANSPTKTPQSPQGAFSPFGTRRGLISTLELMESKSNVLDDIAHLDVGPDPTSPQPKPRRLLRKKKKVTSSEPRRKESSSRRSTSEPRRKESSSSRSTSEPRRKESHASDRKKKTNKTKHTT